MKLEKARERLERYLKLRKPEPMDNFNEAVNLGIEALKRHQALQKSPYYTLLGLLPGETEE